MIFMPFTWQESENDANILRDNLENAVRQLTIEQRVITALHGGQEKSEETIRDPTGIAEDESIVNKSSKGGEEIQEEMEEEEKEKKLVEANEERSEERIDVADGTTNEDAPEVVEVNGSYNCETDAGGGGDD